jgi:hypothetical protein
MDFPPSHEKRILMFGDDFHGATNIAPLHVFRPNQRRPAADEAQAVRTMNRDHQAL